uniref:Uncharacterized protein n=1 Tax=Oryza meridionalis TaxID=40149 RepID=A0A0E0F3A5_9ORYZ
MGLAVMRQLHQDSFWCSAHVGHYRKPSVSREGARVGAAGSSVPLGNNVVDVASSSTSSEARGRRLGATTGNNRSMRSGMINSDLAFI